MSIENIEPKRGPVGTSVTIELKVKDLKGLDRKTLTYSSVMFGVESAAEVQVDKFEDNKQGTITATITVTAPPGPDNEQVDIVVTTPGGHELGKKTKAFTYSSSTSSSATSTSADSVEPKQKDK